jgi:putative oxidoreductase
MSDSKLASQWTAWNPTLRSLLRIMAAFMFIQHGTAKLLVFPHSLLPSGGTFPINTLIGAGGVVELIGGALLLLGLFSRPVAFVCAGEMAVAFFKVHFPQGFWTITNGGELAVLYCFVWLYISAAGPGPLSLDAMRRRSASR